MRFLGQHLSDFPVKFHDYFLGLPQYINKIDALYERPTDKAVILFSGNYGAYIFAYIEYMMLSSKDLAFL